MSYSPEAYGENFAESYDRWWSERVDEQRVTDLLAQYAEGGPVLELGCGTGQFCRTLAAKGLEVIGLDASQAMLDRAERLGEKGPKVRYVKADFRDFTLEKPVGFTFMIFGSIALVPDQASQVAVFKATAKALRQKGRFLLETPIDAPASSLVPRKVEPDWVAFFSASSPNAENVRTLTHIELGAGKTRTWSTSFRQISPWELDLMAELAGLRRVARGAAWSMAEWVPAHAHVRSLVTVYEKA